jgi:hypothetical protein
MSETQLCAYDEYYYAHDCGRPYQRDDIWLAFFGGIADRIVQDIAPRTALDAGCAMGFLVESLRDRGVDAQGLDISEFALQRVRGDIRPYCRLASVLDPLPQRYDLIVCIEVLEHLSPREADRAVANLCAHTDDVLFSSTPVDYREATHINVQPPEQWAELFARQGLFRDLDYDPGYVTAWAARFRRRTEPVTRLVRDYERRLWQVQRENAEVRLFNGQCRTELAALEQRTVSLTKQLSEIEAAVRLEEQQAVRAADERLAQVLQSRSWRLAQAIQSVWGVLTLRNWRSSS